jgi:predicted O-linked N-acetylglucosamine transferase (SPINDLY family)
MNPSRAAQLKKIATKPAPSAAASKAAFLAQAKTLNDQGQTEQAVQMLLAKVPQVPMPDKVQLRLQAAAYLRRSDKDRALQLMEACVQDAPTTGACWLALASLLDERRESKKAVEAALKALGCELNPGQRVDVGRMLSKLGRDREAIEAVRAGYVASGHDAKFASYALRVALQGADWVLAAQLQAQLLQAHQRGETALVGETPRTHLLWCADEAINVKTIANFAAKQFAVKTPLVTQAWPDGEKRKLRIGYISFDFRNHATSLLHLGAMRHHDHERFEWYGYCTSYDDGSALRRDMLTRFDKVRMFNKLNDQQAAKQIAADKIDVLIDLNGLTEGTRMGILAWRPAPVQISYLGYPGTAGGRFVDYFVADPYTVPAGREQVFPEKVIRIPHTYQINDYLARYLPPKPKRRPQGLPPDVPVIGMFNNVNKLGPQVWASWMRVLKAVPQAVLWVLDLNAMARENLTLLIRESGVDPARVVFAPKAKQEQHLARIQFCDLMLDPWPYGGHTTTGDALFAGVPVLALEGTNFASRVSGGLLVAAGLSQLVQPTIDDYVAKAVELLQAPEELLRIKKYLLRNRAKLPVFDAPARTRHLEAAYLAAHRQAAKGLPATHIRVKDGAP